MRYAAALPKLWIIGFALMQIGSCTTTNVTPAADVNTATSAAESAAMPAPQEPGTPANEEPARPPPKLPPKFSDTQTTKHPAVLALLSEATQLENGGDLEIAAAKLERALRIEPRNAVLWHHLAVVRLRQGQSQLALSLAQKSNSFAARDSDLMERNQRIIEQARMRN